MDADRQGGRNAMSNPDNGSRPQTTGSRPGARSVWTSPAPRAVVVVLAVIGGIAVLSIVGMGVMHFAMMGGVGCC